MSQQNKGDFLLGMLVGETVGAAVALLYAPSSGSETRQQMKSAATDAMDRAGDVASTVKDRASMMKDKAADVATKVRTQAQNMASRSQETAATAGSSPEGENWAAQLPDQSNEDKTRHRDLHELQTSDDAEVAVDRVNDAMQGSGEEAHDIAEQLAQAPSGRRESTL
jgi:gas vesicle protein